MMPLKHSIAGFLGQSLSGALQVGPKVENPIYYLFNRKGPESMLPIRPVGLTP